MKRILFLIIISLIFSCKKLVEKKTKKNLQLESITNINANGANETDIIIDELVDEELVVIKKLKAGTVDNENDFYEIFRNNRENKLEKLNKLEENLLSQYVNFYNENGKQIFPDSVKIKIERFKKAKIEFWEIGEGYTDLRTEPHFYYNLFQKYVTKDFKEYLKQEAIEETELYSADAGLAISFEKIAERALFWESFLLKFPNSKMNQKVVEKLELYTTDYLLGLDNTPTYEVSIKDLNAETIEEFKRFSIKNPYSKITKLINSFTSKLKNTEIDDLRPIIMIEVAETFKQKNSFE